jgi:hypothetical protein
MDQILTSSGLREKIAAGLKITMFSLSYMHQVPRQVKYIKYYQIYYAKLRRNMGMGVLINQILNTHTHTWLYLEWNLHMLEVWKHMCIYMLYFARGLFQHKTKAKCWTLHVLFIICQYNFGINIKCVESVNRVSYLHLLTVLRHVTS